MRRILCAASAALSVLGYYGFCVVAVVSDTTQCSKPSHARLIVVPLLAICGCAMVVCAALCNTAIQNRVPDAMRGRVLSMYTFGFFGFLPFGNLIAGAIAEHRGLPMTMMVLGGGLVAAAIGAIAMKPQSQ